MTRFIDENRHSYRAGLEGYGLAVAEMSAMLDAFVASGEDAALGPAMASGELLRKRTVHGRKHALKSFRRRFLAAEPPLLPLEAVHAALQAISSDTARAQLMLPYLLSTDRLAREVIGWVRLTGTVSESEIGRRVASLLEGAGRVPWSASLLTRWAGGARTLLREVGWLGRGKDRDRRLLYNPQAEAVAFHLFGLWTSGLRGPALLASPLWELLLLDEPEVTSAVATLAQRGWWTLASAGMFVDLRPTMRPPAEWGTHGVG